MAFYVYIIQSELDRSYYIGSTQDLDERLRRHNQGRSTYTKAKRPWKLVYHEEFIDRSSAMKREREIKRQKSKKFIETLVSQNVHVPLNPAERSSRRILRDRPRQK
jgi:putative endonuclease